jgi:hypothetical protein
VFTPAPLREQLPVKLITGFIFNDNDYFLAAVKILERKFGETDFQSQVLPFIYTDYYKQELGEGLKRSFVGFRRLIRPEHLPGIKIFTNKLEQRLSRKKKRRINIDPGYLDHSKLILATTKDYSHRIYLSRGIFAEVTLSFQNRTFAPRDWTYPDYKTDAYIKIFNQIREIYDRQIARLKPRGLPFISKAAPKRLVKGAGR